MTDRHDPRYIDEDDQRARLTARWNDLPMGGWSDDNESAFREAVADQLKADLLPDGSATVDEVCNNIHISPVLENPQ